MRQLFPLNVQYIVKYVTKIFQNKIKQGTQKHEDTTKETLPDSAADAMLPQHANMGRTYCGHRVLHLAQHLRETAGQQRGRHGASPVCLWHEGRRRQLRICGRRQWHQRLCAAQAEEQRQVSGRQQFEQLQRGAGEQPRHRQPLSVVGGRGMLHLFNK